MFLFDIIKTGWTFSIICLNEQERIIVGLHKSVLSLERYLVHRKLFLIKTVSIVEGVIVFTLGNLFINALAANLELSAIQTDLL